MFLFFGKACLLYNTSKIVFRDLFSRSMTWEYKRLRVVQGVSKGSKGLQGVIGGYKGLQGLTGGYKGLQLVTGGDKALQRVTKDYRHFLLTRTFPYTFSWSILHKNQS